jgi:flagellar basal-body rod protein FlgB
MIDKLNASMRFQQEALNLRAQRQEVLGANIAHADTPGYKARDLDFSSKLADVMARGRASDGTSMAQTSARHIAGQQTLVANADLMFRTPLQSSLDGNTVEMDVERVNFADNAMRYEVNLTVISSKIRAMLAATQS